MKYLQCKMVKPVDIACGQQLEQTAYIPEKFAVKGKLLKFKDEHGFWDDGWIVEKVYRKSITALSDIIDSHDAIRHHRRNTGDSLPKNKS